MKCSHPDCARDAVRSFRGSGHTGPVRPEDPPGVPYCGAHYERVRRGKPLGSADVRPRGPCSPYTQGVLDAAAIAEFHGHQDLANLLRKLETKNALKHSSK